MKKTPEEKAATRAAKRAEWERTILELPHGSLGHPGRVHMSLEEGTSWLHFRVRGTAPPDVNGWSETTMFCDDPAHLAQFIHALQCRLRVILREIAESVAASKEVERECVELLKETNHDNH